MEPRIGDMVTIPAGTLVWNSKGSMNRTRSTKKVRVMKISRGRILWNEGMDERRVSYSVKIEDVILPKKEGSLSERVAREYAVSQEDSWVTRDQIAKLCPDCATKMASMGISKVRASSIFNDDRLMAAAIKTAAWENLPKGWTQKSLKSFWESIIGDRKHKVTACIKKLQGKEGIDDPGALCASLADRFEAGWRSNR